MSAFRDMVTADRDAVFLDLEYFGETHTVDGNEITVVIDNDELRKREAELGIAESDMLLFAKTEDLPAGKGSGESLNVDGRLYRITDRREDEGITSVTLAAAVPR